MMKKDMGSYQLWISIRMSLVRSMLFATALIALPVVYILSRAHPPCKQLALTDPSSPAFNETSFDPQASLFISQGRPNNSNIQLRYNFKSYEEYVQLQLKKTTNAKLRKIWMTTEWQKKVELFSAQFEGFMSQGGLIKPGMKALCVGARVGQEVLALRQLGLKDSIGIDLVPSPPLVVKGDIHKHPFKNNTFDFEFSNVFDHALFPSLFMSEIERTLKPGGVAVIHVSVKRRADKYSANDLRSLDAFLSLLKQSDVLHVKEIDLLGLDTEVAIRKRYAQEN
ncbi:hypothetical protein O6H91_04G015300 [Diphasiastrum complanatum]|uniref:Uncharacterized protein n=1 Tax=Diphasiastrum complanatum TaxID=34168 RepID=A0ACC2DUG1_DIPCM|nr:hypothetical protein O6H91_Y356800 [Diphasiastrum complanatum]KAJ7298936.1 hypothetical protein O6H91_Y356800 [Diphasiastrum complanatum]KAJ7557910.1 hypothetical protein O6H91_04G015300 [Diphasiastrum complanatum]